MRISSASRTCPRCARRPPTRAACAAGDETAQLHAPGKAGRGRWRTGFVVGAIAGVSADPGAALTGSTIASQTEISTTLLLAIVAYLSGPVRPVASFSVRAGMPILLRQICEMPAGRREQAHDLEGLGASDDEFPLALPVAEAAGERSIACLKLLG